MVRAIAYKLQENAFGGLKSSVRRLLEKGAEDACARRPIKIQRPPKIRAGTVLLREWHGTTHQVTVTGGPSSIVASAIAPSPRSHGSSPAADGPALCSSASNRPERRAPMEATRRAIQRCAIYTRKSSEEGLEQDFNSLHAQREACDAFIKSQQGEGWRLVKTAYDDGGLSGGTMERPALQRLLDDIREGQVDVVVVYKVDRLTRSLADFAKMVEVFDARGIPFVAVTQQFNTTTSMGRLTHGIDGLRAPSFSLSVPVH
jgi:hypothetical protein